MNPAFNKENNNMEVWITPTVLYTVICDSVASTVLFPDVLMSMLINVGLGVTFQIFKQMEHLLLSSL